MSITLTINTATLTADETGALLAFLMTAHPDAVQAALARLDGPVEVRGEPLRPDLDPVEERPVLDWSAPPPAVEVADAPMTPAEAFGGTVQTPPEIDALGLPWDERIHATGRDGRGVMTDKGVWRKKRGLNQLVEHRVLAELRAVYPDPAERTMQVAVAAGLIPPPPPVGETPALPPVPAAPGVVPPPPSAPTFAEAMQRATAAQAAGHITTAETMAIVMGELGLGAMRELAATANAHLVPRFVAAVQARVDAAMGA